MNIDKSARLEQSAICHARDSWSRCAGGGSGVSDWLVSEVEGVVRACSVSLLACLLWLVLSQCSSVDFSLHSLTRRLEANQPARHHQQDSLATTLQQTNKKAAHPTATTAQQEQQERKELLDSWREEEEANCMLHGDRHQTLQHQPPI